MISYLSRRSDMNQTFRTFFNPGMIVLMLLMAATRFHHFGSSVSLPDASVAVFFLAGFWSGGLFGLVTLLIEAGLIDYFAITQFGVSDYCISPAYVFLIPTYAVVWYTGRYCAHMSYSNKLNWMKSLGLMVGSVSIAFFISNGSFFMLSENITDRSWDIYASGVVRYYPQYVGYSIFYVSLFIGLQQVIQSMVVPESKHRMF